MARGLRGGTTSISGQTSSQFLTALLMAAPMAENPVTIRIFDQLTSQPYVRMTMALMERFGVRVSEQDMLEFGVEPGQTYRSPGRVHVEGDASSASYFLAAAAITGGKVRVNGCGTDSLQGDAKFAEVLTEMGAKVDWEPESITVTGTGGLKPIKANMASMPDAAMTLAVLAIFADGPSLITGIANWRVKETDRMEAVSTELEKLGAKTQVGPNFLVVEPPNRIRGARIATYNDHRMAMAFSLAACGTDQLIIEDPKCVAKTFPDYFEVLGRMADTGDTE